MTSKTSSTLNELIQLLHDGETFYNDAAQKVGMPYRDLFQRMARIKVAIASELAVHVTGHGDTPSESGTVMGKLRKSYADLRASIGKNPEKVYVAQLEETEDRILEAFRSHLKDSDITEVRNILTRHLPEVQKTHDEMRALKINLAA
jgi:uncharacterized protein (TIGR02284 family)